MTRHANLEEESQVLLQLRKDRGIQCIDIVSPAEELETAASDTISDILTAVFGAAGTSRPWADGEVRSGNEAVTYRERAIERAQGLLAHALRSWEGDAEDYTREDA